MGGAAGIKSIAVMNEGGVLIGGRDGALYEGSFDTSLETLKRHLPGIIEKGAA